MLICVRWHCTARRTVCQTVARVDARGDLPLRRRDHLPLDAIHGGHELLQRLLVRGPGHHAPRDVIQLRDRVVVCRPREPPPPSSTARWRCDRDGRRRPSGPKVMTTCGLMRRRWAAIASWARVGSTASSPPSGKPSSADLADAEFPAAAARSSASRVAPTTSGPGCSPRSPNRPRSPRVAVTRYVSTPSAAYLASVPPVPSDSSSGWARTHIRRSVTTSPRDDRLQILRGHDESCRRFARAASSAARAGRPRGPACPLASRAEKSLVRSGP